MEGIRCKLLEKGQGRWDAKKKGIRKRVEKLKTVFLFIFLVFLGYNLVHDYFFCYEVISQSDHMRSIQRCMRL